MTGFALNQLAWHLPPPETNNLPVQFRHETGGQESLIRHRESEFLEAYTNLAFGWYACRTLAANHIPFPAVFEGEDEALFRAYLFNCSTRYYNRDVAEALALTSPKMKIVRQSMEALLVTADTIKDGVPISKIEEVSKITGLRPMVVSTYEKLFFNILDRKADAAFIAQTIYPDGRTVEAYEDYTVTADLGMLLKRAAYNHGPYDTLYLAGFHGGLLHNLSQDGTVAKQLEAMMMANGLILARNGWMNQQTNGQGLFNARTLLAAAKQGGADETPQSPFQSMGKILMSDIKKAKGGQADEQIARRNKLVRKAQVVEPA